jgi:branched-chain amino acid transport system permease protein
VLVIKEDLVAALVAPRWWHRLALFFQKTATGRLCARWRRPPGRAIDRHTAQAHLSSCEAGFAALVAGGDLGAKLGVQFPLSLVALKALPVVILAA